MGAAPANALRGKRMRANEAISDQVPVAPRESLISHGARAVSAVRNTRERVQADCSRVHFGVAHSIGAASPTSCFHAPEAS